MLVLIPETGQAVAPLDRQFLAQELNILDDRDSQQMYVKFSLSDRRHSWQFDVAVKAGLVSIICGKPQKS